MTSPDYFLNCNSEESITTRFKKLAIEMHPDKNPGDPGATANFQEMMRQRDIAIRKIFARGSKDIEDLDLKVFEFTSNLEKNIFKSSSLNDLSKDLGDGFMKEHPDQDVSFNNVFKYVLDKLMQGEKQNRLGKDQDKKKLE